MKPVIHVSILGLALVALFAITALAAASASAAQPEFKVCGKAAKNAVTKKYEGKYEKGCTAKNAKGEGKYETEEVKTPAAFTGKSKASTFYYYNEHGIVWEVTCTKDAAKGDITSPTEYVEAITFEKCSATNEVTKAKDSCPNITVGEPFSALAETYPGEEAGFVTIGYTLTFTCGSVEFTAMNNFGVGKVENGKKGPLGVFAVNKATGEQKITGLVFGGETYSPVHLESTVAGEGGFNVGVENTEALGPKGVVVVG